MKIFDWLYGSETTALVEKDRIKKLEGEREELSDKVLTLTREVKELELDRKIADEDIKHMVKMREERMEIEASKKDVERDRVQQEAIAEVKDMYRDKVEENLESQLTNMKDMYGQILERLPNVTARFKATE